MTDLEKPVDLSDRDQFGAQSLLSAAEPSRPRSCWPSSFMVLASHSSIRSPKRARPKAQRKATTQCGS